MVQSHHSACVSLFSQNHLLKRLHFSYWLFLALLPNISWPGILRFNSWLSILFHWFIEPMYVYIFLTIVFQWCFKSRSMISLAFFFSLRVVFSTEGLFQFHANFRIVSSISVKNEFAVLMMIALNLQMTLGMFSCLLDHAHLLALFLLSSLGLHSNSYSYLEDCCSFFIQLKHLLCA